jgi:hypothetical protein
MFELLNNHFTTNNFHLCGKKPTVINNLLSLVELF